jgi:hypothetical protein
MSSTSYETARLSDDIRQIFINAFGVKYEMIRMCRDHNDPLLHQDKKPVLNITQDEFVGIFNVNSNHYLLPSGQACRLGIYCRLPLPNLVALIMKAEWESFLSVMAGHLSASGAQSTGPDLIERYGSAFKPDPGKIFKLIMSNSDDSVADITYSRIGFIINDLLEQGRFLTDNYQAGQAYSEKEITEEIFLSKTQKSQQEIYFRLKKLWKTKSTELDDLLMYFERKKRLNIGLENKYFRFFGDLETEKSKFTYRYEKCKAILEIMSENPGLSYRELIRLAGEKITEAERERNDLKNKITRSHNIIDNIIPEGTAPTVTDEFKNYYMLECKRLLRKLFFLLHTDTCPNYSGLSLQKKTEINKLWLELMKSTKEEVYSFSPSMMLYSLPDYEQLQSIYRRACEILGMDPDCFETGDRLEFLIKKGAHPDKILEFLKSETEQLELHLARLELVQNEYTNEDQTQIYRSALENINIHTGKLKSAISDLKSEILKLKKQIAEEHIKVT